MVTTRHARTSSCKTEQDSDPNKHWKIEWTQILNSSQARKSTKLSMKHCSLNVAYINFVIILFFFKYNGVLFALTTKVTSKWK